MSFCDECGNQLSTGAKFCSNCGTSTMVDGEQQAPYQSQYASQEWLRLDDVINNRERRLGAIGALLAFLGGFCPWSTVNLPFYGYVGGSYGIGSPLSWLAALGAIAAAIFLFRLGSGSIVMVIGIGIAALAVLSALMSMGGQVSPSWGVLLTLAGGGLLGYSGYLTRLY